MARLERPEGGDEKADWFWAIASGCLLAAMGIGSLFGWIASRGKKEEKPARREKTDRKPDPAAPLKETAAE